MGLDKLTAYIIATRDDIVITFGGPANNGKYVGWITLGEEDHYRPLLNTQAIYDMPEDAQVAMKKVVTDIKDAVEKETGGKHPIDYVLGNTWEAKLAKEIVNGSNMENNYKIQKILGPDAYFRDGEWWEMCCGKEIRIDGWYKKDDDYCFWSECYDCGTNSDWEGN
jgi:hypothetical protein